MSWRGALTVAMLAALLGAAVMMRLGVGGTMENLTPEEQSQVVELRRQRAVLGMVVGAALAVGGVLLQSLLRNPLASPDLLGLASGAALAVIVAQYLAGGPFVPGGNGPAALGGALGGLLLVYALSQRGGFVDPVSLVLVGVIVSVMCGAATMGVAMLMPDRGFGVARWTIGALDDNAPSARVWVIGGITAACIAAGWWAGRAMDAAALSEDEARSVGVPLGGLRLLLFLLSGVLTAGAVMLAGPIGFVGLVCPHAVRLLAGPGHRVLVVGSALAGSAMLVGADALVKVLDLGGGRLPIGVLTALLGGPLLILLLRTEAARRRGD